MKPSPQNQLYRRGFTLLEVLIALAILAVSSLAVLSQSGQSLSQLQQLQAKTQAIIIAENQLNGLQIVPRWPALGSDNQTITMADQQWRVTTEVSATSDPWFRKIAVSVAIDDQPDAVLAQLVGYRGLH